VARAKATGTTAGRPPAARRETGPVYLETTDQARTASRMRRGLWTTDGRTGAQISWLAGHRRLLFASWRVRFGICRGVAVAVAVLVTAVGGWVDGWVWSPWIHQQNNRSSGSKQKQPKKQQASKQASKQQRQHSASAWPALHCAALYGGCTHARQPQAADHTAATTGRKRRRRGSRPRGSPASDAKNE